MISIFAAQIKRLFCAHAHDSWDIVKFRRNLARPSSNVPFYSHAHTSEQMKFTFELLWPIFIEKKNRTETCVHVGRLPQPAVR